MTDTEKLDNIIERLDRIERVLNKVLKLAEEDTPSREFLLNLGADILGSAIIGK